MVDLAAFIMKFIQAIKKSLRIYVVIVADFHFRPQRFLLKRGEKLATTKYIVHKVAR